MYTRMGGERPDLPLLILRTTKGHILMLLAHALPSTFPRQGTAAVHPQREGAGKPSPPCHRRHLRRSNPLETHFPALPLAQISLTKEEPNICAVSDLAWIWQAEQQTRAALQPPHFLFSSGSSNTQQSVTRRRLLRAQAAKEPTPRTPSSTSAAVPSGKKRAQAASCLGARLWQRYPYPWAEPWARGVPVSGGNRVLPAAARCGAPQSHRQHQGAGRTVSSGDGERCRMLPLPSKEALPFEEEVKANTRSSRFPVSIRAGQHPSALGNISTEPFTESSALGFSRCF